jgi:hypothetical protein
MASGLQLSPVIRIAVGAIVCAGAAALDLTVLAIVGAGLIAWGVVSMFADRDECE